MIKGKKSFYIHNFKTILQVIVAGGYLTVPQGTASVYFLDVKTLTFSHSQYDLPGPKALGVLVQVGLEMFLIGGTNGVTGGATKDVLNMNSDTFQWTVRTDLSVTTATQVTGYYVYNI